MQVSKQVFGAMMGLATGIVMSLSISLVMVLATVGLVDAFLVIWFKSFLTSFAVSTPVALVAIPLTEWALRRVVRVRDDQCA